MGSYGQRGLTRSMVWWLVGRSGRTGRGGLCGRLWGVGLGNGVGSCGRAEREALWRGRGGEEGCLGDGGKGWGLDGVEGSVNSGYGSS